MRLFILKILGQFAFEQQLHVCIEQATYSYKLLMMRDAFFQDDHTTTIMRQ